MPNTTEIDPKSAAGVLLREHDNIEQAIRYADRKAKFLLMSHYASGLAYAEAARQLRAEVVRRFNQANQVNNQE